MDAMMTAVPGQKTAPSGDGEGGPAKARRMPSKWERRQ